MNKFLIIRVAHFIFLGLSLIFIYFYFAFYQPAKFQSICSEASAKAVLKLDLKEDAYGLYKTLYKNCISQR